jgi:serine/threonine-protein kinase
VTGHDPHLADALRDRYVLMKELGHGGMATVYLARDLRHERQVALKVLHGELAATLGPDRFLREIRTAARLQHPHILSVFESGESTGRLWFTMPYVEGESLRDRLRRERQLPLEDALRITREAAQALRYAHDHGIVHRDIKPENLLLTEDGNTLVADFGIARALSTGDQEETRLTETGMAVGTPAYMSPEQATGATDLDARTDVYSLGCVLYEMLAGEPPFTGPTPQAVIAKRLAGPAPSVSVLRQGVPPPVVGAVQRALALAPADRFAGVADFARRLDAGTWAPAKVPRRRRLVGPLVAALAALLAGYLGLQAAGLFPEATLVSEGVLAPRDQLVLTEFADRAGDSSLATAVTEALRVDFAQSRLVGLASPERVRSALRLMRRPDTARLTPALGREVALREGFKAVLSGEVTRLGEGYMLSAQVVGADSGQVLAAHRESAVSATEIIPAVDRLSRKLRRHIGESLRRVRAGAPLEAVTTGSLDALRLYSLGARLSGAGRYDDALPFLENAVRLDTAFATAWYALATNLWNLRRDPSRQVEALSRAYALRDRLPERERYATEAQYFEWVLDDRARARAAWRALLAVDPERPGALTNLGLSLWFEEDYAGAAELAARAIRADSTAIAPYTNLVDAQVTLGRFAAAETTLARWRARFGADAGYEVQVGLMAGARGNYDSAARAFGRALVPGAGTADRSRAAELLTALADVRGRFREARRYDRLKAELDGSAAGMLLPAVAESWADLRLALDPGRAARRLDSLIASPRFERVEAADRPYDEIALIYAMAGRHGKAREVAAEGERAVRASGPAGERLLAGRDHRMFVDGLEGTLLLQEERFDEAVARFRRARGAYGGAWWLPELGMAFDRSGNSDSALAVYERYLASTHNFRIHPDAAHLGPVLRRVGELYEARGNRPRAARAYQRFVALWRDADPVLQPQVAEVRGRLAAVAGEP